MWYNSFSRYENSLEGVKMTVTYKEVKPYVSIRCMLGKHDYRGNKTQGNKKCLIITYECSRCGNKAIKEIREKEK